MPAGIPDGVGKNDEIIFGLTDQERARFEAKVWQLGDACWPWIGATIQSDDQSVGVGYGALTIRKRSFRAHRVAHILATGKLIPDGLDICHSCDYRRCCNPAHLTAKTREQNVADMMRRGRHWSQGFVYAEPPMPEVPEEVRLTGLRRLLVANFWANTQKAGPDECWLWTGATKQGGYGRIEMKCRALGLRQAYLAHRLSYELNSGSVPDAELSVRHSCDNPPCVNPNHLLLGTHQDNMDDRTERGRTFRPIGALSGRNKIGTDDDAVFIRQAVASGTPRKLLASQYDVHVQTIHDIVSRKSWKHVP